MTTTVWQPMDRHGASAPQSAQDRAHLDRYHELAQSDEILSGPPSSSTRFSSILNDEIVFH